MGVQPIIPAADPMPLPAPFWLFKLLLIVTFILHIVLMNLMLGGGVIATVTRFLSGKNEKFLQLSQNISKKLPTLLAATVTLGVAPLLFVQVLYGQLFYASSIIMGWPWFLVVVLVTVAYYGLYLVAFKGEGKTIPMAWILSVSFLLLLLVGLIYSNNFTLMITPAKWMKIYQADPSGWNLNVGEPTLIPRFLHFLVASLAIGGLLIVFVGLFRWEKEKEYARFLIGYGGRWFMYATMVQILVGIWFLIALPKPNMMLFMGKNILGTLGLLIGIVGGLASIFVMSGALRSEDPRRGAITTMTIVGVIVVFMAIMRDILRDSYLEPLFKASSLAVKTQWDVLILFLILFIGGVILWLMMIKKYFFLPRLRTEK